MPPDINRFHGKIPIIGSVTVTLDQAEPMDIIMAIGQTMPNYATAVAQHVRQAQMMVDECRNTLRAAGVVEIKRANVPQHPDATNGGDGGAIVE